MIKWVQIKLFRFKRRNNVYYSLYMNHYIRIVKIYDWDDWVWEVADAASNNRFGTSNYDVRQFVKRQGRVK